MNFEIGKKPNFCLLANWILRFQRSSVVQIKGLALLLFCLFLDSATAQGKDVKGVSATKQAEIPLRSRSLEGLDEGISDGTQYKMEVDGLENQSPPKAQLSESGTLQLKLFGQQLEVDADEPAVYKQEGAPIEPPLLKQIKIEDQPSVMMETDKPDYIPLFFDPVKNGVIYAHQEIEYDLTNPLILRVGPMAVTAAGVVMRFSREMGQLNEFDFGLDVQTKFSNMYMVSFQWPIDLVPDGTIELFDDDGQVLWKKDAGSLQLQKWKTFLDSQAKMPDVSQDLISGSDDESSSRSTAKRAQIPASLRRLQITGHDQSSYGLFGKEIFEIPVWQIAEPFRFCVTKDAPEGRVALCSKRYRFHRKGGRFWLVAENKVVKPKVFVNDRPMTLKGSAVFVDDKKPIKFAALMGNGTYFEFVSFPKKITIVDMVLNQETQEIELIGFGPPPLGNVVRLERYSRNSLDFLNFDATIGDFRKFWKATYPAQGGSLYLRGYGGAPFKQPFVFERLPKKTIRPRIHISSPKSTFSDTTTLRGETTAPVKVATHEQSARNISPTRFDWEFLAKERGVMNSSRILIKDGEHTFQAFHEIYKGYPRELSGRMTGVLTNNLEMVLLGEVAFQIWWERLFWWDHPLYSHQRWGLNAKYFQSLAAVGGSSQGQSLIRLEVGTADLKYRLTPGIWGRDHTFGVMLDAQHVRIEDYMAQMGGVGLFWARSMPGFIDRVFNILPFMRYPKWVDVDGIVYLVPFSPNNQLGFNTSVNFHGKLMWSQRFFGEAGFGMKLFQFNDLAAGKSIGLAVAYGTVGLGFNF